MAFTTFVDSTGATRLLRLPNPTVLLNWSDYNDAATAVTPVAMPAANTFYALPNDGLGPYTSTVFEGVQVYDPSTNRFNFSSLEIGDTIDIRVDVLVSTVGSNAVVVEDMLLGGGIAQYTLQHSREEYKVAGTYQIVSNISVYIGDAVTRDGYAELRVSADTAGCSVVVNGWFTKVARSR